MPFHCFPPLFRACVRHRSRVAPWSVLCFRRPFGGLPDAFVGLFCGVVEWRCCGSIRSGRMTRSFNLGRWFPTRKSIGLGVFAVPQSGCSVLIHGRGSVRYFVRSCSCSRGHGSLVGSRCYGASGRKLHRRRLAVCRQIARCGVYCRFRRCDQL